MGQYRDNKRNTWFAKFSYRDQSGKKKQKMKRGFLRKKDAAEYERQFRERFEGSTEMSFCALVRLYLEDRRINVKYSTYQNKLSRIERWLVPFFGERLIADITPGDVRWFYNHLREEKSHRGKPMSSSYRFTLSADLSSVFNFAQRFYNLHENPCHKVGYAGKNTRRLNFWTKEEFDCFIATFSHDDIYYVVFMVLYYTGLRKGELQALTSADIDFKAGVIHVTKTYNGSGPERITVPKTECSIRDVTLPPTLLKVLRQFLRNGEHDETELLFPRGKSTFARQLKKHAVIAGVPVIKIHELRHSHASFLINLGCNVLLISQRLGHSDIKMTLNVYGHLFPSKQKELADKLESVLFA